MQVVSNREQQDMLLTQSPTGGQPDITDENAPFEHRCALTHGRHFKEEKKKSRRACRKLILVSMVSFVFCGSEAAGGTISGSLAILCDAAHQLSDVAGFVISFLAIYMTQKEQTLKYSYGYNRADVIGALASIAIIWGLLVWLLIEAVHRLLNPSEINGELMLITACFGLGCNIANLLILQCCCNDKEGRGKKTGLLDSIASAYKPMHGNSISHAVRSQKSQKSKSRRGESVTSKHSHMSKYDADQDLEEVDTPKLKGNAEDPESPAMQDSHKRLNGTMESNLLSTEKKQESQQSGVKRSDNRDVDMIIEEEQDGSTKGAQLNKKSDASMRTSPEVEEVDTVEGDDDENLNVRAAIVHMVGDMVQSVGVIIAAIIIYIKPDWTIADPICTFLFTILVMFTTVPIFKDCMRFLMETAPEDIDQVEVYNEIKNLSFVKEIHDFHMWALSDGKVMFTAHLVVTGNPSYALYNVTELLQKEFGIYHSTIQMEPAKKSHFTSGKPGLLPCVNEFNFDQNVQMRKKLEV